MKKQKILLLLVITIGIVLSFQVLVNATTIKSSTKVNYTYCEAKNKSFGKGEYNTHFDCSNADTTISLSHKNKAATRLNGCPASNTYKEAYVGLKNSSGQWKSDTSSNSSSPTVGAKINPIGFTPIQSQHDLLFYEPTGYKMHTRTYK